MFKIFDLSDFNRAAQTFWLAVVAAGASLSLWAAVNVFYLNTSSAGLLTTLALLAFIAGFFPVRVPRTSAIISAADAIVFLGLIYLGIPAAIVICAAGAVAVRLRTSNSARDAATDAAASIIAVFAAGNLFYLALRIYVAINDYPLSNNLPDVGKFAFALIVLATAQFLLVSLISGTLLALHKRRFAPQFSASDVLVSSLSYFLGAIAAGTVQLAESNLGFVSGLISLPLVILPYAAYKLHFRQLNEKNDEIAKINRVQLATVETLAAAVDAREQASPGHTRRVQIYAVGLGKALDLPIDEIKALESAALLHDIGKLAVPDFILNKPGELTRLEMDKVKIHTIVGAEILQSVNFPYPVVPAVLHHHERWDGEGYPEQLRGEEIPAPARVLAIADAFDVIREGRPYRAALSREDARKALIAGAGTQFDPRLVDIFLRHLKQFEDEIAAAGISQEIERRAETQKAQNVHVVNAPRSVTSYFEEIKRANQEVFALYDLARLSSSSLNLEDTATFFLEKVQQLVPLETCVVYLYDERREIAFAAHSAGKNAAFLRERKISLGEGVTGFVLKNHKSVCSVSPALDFTSQYVEIAEQYSTMAALPLKVGDKLVGALAVYSENLLCYEEEHLRLLETVSSIAANALLRSIQHAETESRAMTDPMTHLPNARSLQTHFEREAARARRSNHSFHVVMLDLDDFKKVNDTYGHKAGDYMLREISKVMRAQLREYDFLARYAGDEFVAIVPEVAGLPIAELCRRIEAAVKDFALPVGVGATAAVGVSIGAASFPADGETLDQVLIAADQNMYSVKAAHKQRRESANAADTHKPEIYSIAVN